MKMTIEIILAPTSAAIAEGELHVGIRIYGFEYACRHINGELRVDYVSGQKYAQNRPAWQRAKNYQAACKWFADYVSGMNAAYHEAHRNLYSEAA